MFLIMMFGVIGNISISIIILKNKLLRLQPINLFLLNLAVSDLLHLCVSTTLFLFRRNILFTNYYLGRFCCLSTPFLNGKYSRVWNKSTATFINLKKKSWRYALIQGWVHYYTENLNKLDREVKVFILDFKTT